MEEQAVSLLQKRFTIPVLIGLVTFSGGAGLGYILGKRRGKYRYRSLTNVKQYLAEKYPEQYEERFEGSVNDEQSEKAEPYTLVTADGEVVIEAPPRPDPTDDSVTYQPMQVNVFSHHDIDWDYEAEMSTRKGDVPYVIHRDEFFGEEMGFTQSTLTYYKGDDILVDEQDVPMYDYNRTVGELKFGHGSKDQNVVYVRNETLECDYEILLSQGHYTVEVLGHEIEAEYAEDDLKHSSIRKFKPRD